MVLFTQHMEPDLQCLAHCFEQIFELVIIVHHDHATDADFEQHIFEEELGEVCNYKILHAWESALDLVIHSMQSYEN